MSEPVLERSVLERKERDELQTIAKALGAEPSARMKKADLVDLVLRAAGIGPETPAAGDTPAGADRGRGRGGAKPAAVTGAPDATSPSDGSPNGPGAATDDGVQEGAGDGDGGLSRDGAGDGAPASAGNGQRSAAPGEASPATRRERADRSRSQPDRDRGDRGEPDRNDGGNGHGGQGRAQSGQGQQGNQAAQQGERQGQQGDRQGQQGNQAAQQGERQGQQGDRQGQQGERQGQQGNQAAQQGERQGQQGDRQGQQGDRQGQQGNQAAQQGERQGQQGDRQGQQGERQGQQGNQAGQGPNGQGDEGEGGNRRRRRRNRDRTDGQGERVESQPDDAFNGEPVDCDGLLDLRDEGYGFLRVKGYLPHRDDVYVSVRQVRQLGLRKGDHVTGANRPANRQEKNPALLRIDLVNGQDPEVARRRPRFEDLTPLFPDEKLRLETPNDPTNMTARIVDLVSPIGKGQRGLIVSPPKAGKTTILKQIVRSIERNNPDVHLMVLLVDERPEEVTDMRRSTDGEVIASTFDRPADEHTAVSELAIERAKRLVEEGKDVVIVLDGITRLARAYNLAAPATGRIMSGGIDTGALYPPKKFFGAARNVEEGGSLTILATALIETGSKMDEVIFEEFKGTGNMELRLDRRLAERRIYPAIDVDASSTRHEELLFSRQQLQQVWRVRRALHALSSDAGSPAAALERLMDGMKTFKTNDEFLAEAAKAGGAAT